MREIIEFFTYTETILPLLLRGVWFTVLLFTTTLVLSIPLGLPFSLGSISKFKPFSLICKTYIWLFRGTPLLLQLYFFYFFLPKIIPGAYLSPFLTALLTFVLNYAAYFAEIYRAGIQSIDRGQYEAAASLGISRSATMFNIIIPQAVKRVIPPVSNEAITLIKDTALASSISLAELMKNAKGRVNADVRAEAYIVAAAFYLVLTFIMTVVSKKLEERFSRHERKD